MLRETGSSVKPSPYLLFFSRLKIVGYVHEKFLCHPDLLFPSPSVFNARHRIEHSLFSRVHPSFRFLPFDYQTERNGKLTEETFLLFPLVKKFEFEIVRF